MTLRDQKKHHSNFPPVENADFWQDCFETSRSPMCAIKLPLKNVPPTLRFENGSLEEDLTLSGRSSSELAGPDHFVF